SVLAFRHDVLSIAGQCQGSSRTHGRPPEVARHDTDSVCRHKTHRRIRFRYLSPDRIEDRAGAIRRRLSTRELNPDVGQPETLGDSSLGRHNTIRGDAAVMYAHAAVHKDRVEIGLSVIQLGDPLTVFSLVGPAPLLDFTV